MIIEREPPALVIADLRLPAGDGLELVRAARRLPTPTPSMVVRGFASEASRMAALAAGASANLAKPFAAAAFISLVKKHWTLANSFDRKPAPARAHWWGAGSPVVRRRRPGREPLSASRPGENRSFSAGFLCARGWHVRCVLYRSWVGPKADLVHWMEGRMEEIEGMVVQGVTVGLAFRRQWPPALPVGGRPGGGAS